MVARFPHLPTPSRDASRSQDVDGFLRTAAAVAEPGRAARLIFALDATMSRQPTWDLAAGVQAGMFEAAASLGSLSVQLVYFRGSGECRSSRWVADPRALSAMMTGIDCRSGPTQIGRVLRHAEAENGRATVRAIVFVGDAMEENIDDLCAVAGRLGLRGVKAFMFHEGGDGAAGQAFAQVARLTGGAALAFDARAPASLAGLLRAVAAYARGGEAALRRVASASPEGRRLLASMPAGTGRGT